MEGVDCLRTMLTNLTYYFFSQLRSHLLDISRRIILIRSRTDKITRREQELYVVLDLSHIKGISLEAMHQENDVLNILCILVISNNRELKEKVAVKITQVNQV